MFIMKSFKIGKKTWLNLSNKGVSVSKKIGNITLNTNGTIKYKKQKGTNYKKQNK